MLSIEYETRLLDNSLTEFDISELNYGKYKIVDLGEPYNTWYYLRFDVLSAI